VYWHIAAALLPEGYSTVNPTIFRFLFQYVEDLKYYPITIFNMETDIPLTRCSLHPGTACPETPNLKTNQPEENISRVCLPPGIEGVRETKDFQTEGSKGDMGFPGNDDAGRSSINPPRKT